MTINIDNISIEYRKRLVDTSRKHILISKLKGSQQEQDLTKPVNCGGFGRIRHFRRFISDGWPLDPLPNDPASKALGIKPMDIIEAQVFQIAGCNYRCWYCFVPYCLISGDDKYAKMLTAGDLIDMHLNQDCPPLVIDLSGGQPDLVPEWVPWVMDELLKRGLEKGIYLWSDDNLSNDFFWKHLSKKDIKLIRNYKNYGRVCCFKGFNSESFCFNTGAKLEYFDRQFQLFKKLLTLNIDLYAYVTLTTPSLISVDKEISEFIDKLQQLDGNLPLRTVPLKIQVFSPVRGRLNNTMMRSLENQQIVANIWKDEIDRRFSLEQRITSIADVPLGDGNR